MKTISMMCLALLFTGATSLKAQSVFDKIDKALGKVDKAANTADRTKGTSDKLLGFLSKKQKNAEEVKGETSTVISITGIDFSTLKALSENIQKCKGVESAKIKYSAASSTVQVQHTGSSEDLLKLMQKSDVKEVFDDKNLEGLEDGKIALKLPKKK
uniref:hypothetical protein n=1 Tax=Pedobacter schmidteae TaxID=2201271 RepID=UPI000EAED3F8|nr:hypothetical protein [Pedobacter schmidteae]